MRVGDRVEVRIGNPEIKPTGAMLIGRGEVTGLVGKRKAARRWIYVHLDDEEDPIPFRPSEVTLLDPITALAELAP